MALGMSLEQLITIYRLQFPVLHQNEEDTWYDARGRIIFTPNKGLFGVGIDRKEWENIRKTNKMIHEKIIIDNAISDEEEKRKIEYVGPYTRCSRENDYRAIWGYFEKRFTE